MVPLYANIEQGSIDISSFAYSDQFHPGVLGRISLAIINENHSFVLVPLAGGSPYCFVGGFLLVASQLKDH
jgi:hypothetical protein